MNLVTSLTRIELELQIWEQIWSLYKREASWQAWVHIRNKVYIPVSVLVWSQLWEQIWDKLQDESK